VLNGKNDTGKTSLLEAIETMAGLAVGRWPQRRIGRLAWRGADSSYIEWTAEIGPSPRNGLVTPTTYHRRVYVGPTPARVQVPSARQPDLDEEFVEVRDAQMGSAVTDGSPKALVPVRAALSEVAKYHFDPALLNEPSPFTGHFGEFNDAPRLASDGRGLALVLDYLLGARRKTFDAIERELHEAVPFIQSIQIRPWSSENGPKQVGKSLAFELSGSGQEVSADVVSDGVLLFLAYLTLVNAPDPPSILLIEEPENGIHPRQLQRVAEYLKRLSDPARGANAVQIVTATHSPYFLDFVEPSSVLVFGRRLNGETVVAPLLSLPGVKERLDSGFSLGEMWFNVGEDRLLAETLK
jgi:hypothetical protein